MAWDGADHMEELRGQGAYRADVPILGQPLAVQPHQYYQGVDRGKSPDVRRDTAVPVPDFHQHPARIGIPSEGLQVRLPRDVPDGDVVAHAAHYPDGLLLGGRAHDAYASGNQCQVEGLRMAVSDSDEVRADAQHVHVADHVAIAELRGPAFPAVEGYAASEVVVDDPHGAVLVAEHILHALRRPGMLEVVDHIHYGTSQNTYASVHTSLNSTFPSDATDSMYSAILVSNWWS